MLVQVQPLPQYEENGVMVAHVVNEYLIDTYNINYNDEFGISVV